MKTNYDFLNSENCMDYNFDIDDLLKSQRIIAESLRIQYFDVDKEINKLSLETKDETNSNRLIKLRDLQNHITRLNQIKLDLKDKIEIIRLQVQDEYEKYEIDSNILDAEIENIFIKIEKFEKEGRTKLLESQKKRLNSLYEIKKLEASINNFQMLLDKIEAENNEKLVFIETKEEIEANIREYEKLKFNLLEIMEIDEDLIEEEIIFCTNKAKIGSEVIRNKNKQKLETLSKIRDLIENIKIRKADLDKIVLIDLIKERDCLIVEYDLKCIQDVHLRKSEIEEELTKINPRRTAAIKELKDELDIIINIINLDNRIKSIHENLKLSIIEDEKEQFNNLNKDLDDRIYGQNENILEGLENNFKDDNQEQIKDNKDLILKEEIILEEQPKIANKDIIQPSDQEENDDHFTEVMNNLEEYNSTPYSAEKLIIKQILIFYINVSNNQVKNTLSKLIPTFLSIELTLELNELENKLIEEKLFDIKLFKVLISNLRSSCSNKCVDKDLLDNLKKALTFLRPINITKLKRLIKVNVNYENLIVGQEVIVLCAKSGTGKSTTIHYMSGSEMGKVVKEGVTYDYYEPKKVFNQYLKNVVSGHSMRSETSTIIPVKVDLQDLGFITNEQAILIDMPGYDDTREVEIDLSQALAIYKSLSKAKSIRFIFLFSSKDIGNNLEGLVKSAKYIVNMFKFDHNDKDEISKIYKSFSYLFTRYQQNTNPIQIHKEILDKFNNLNHSEKSNKPLTQLMKFIINDTNGGARIIFPNDKDQRLPLWNHILNKNPIKNLEETLNYCVSDDTTNIINNMLKIYSSTISNAINRNDFNLIIYKLDEMNYYYEITELETIKRELDSCLDNIKNHLDIHYKNTYDMFNKTLDELNKLTTEDIKELKESIQLAELSNSLRNSYLKDKVASLRHYELILEDGVGKLMNKIECHKVDDEVFLKLFSKIFTIKNTEPKYIDQFKKVKIRVEDYINNLIKEYNNSLIQGQYTNCEITKRKVETIKKTMIEYLDMSYIETSLNELNKKTIEFFENVMNNYKTIIDTCKSKNSFTDDEIHILNTNEEKINNLISTDILKSLYNEEDIKKSLKYLVDIEIEMFDNYTSNLKKILTDLSSTDKKNVSFDLVEPLFKQLQLIIKRYAIENIRYKQYLEIKQNITTTVLKFQMISNNIIKTIFNDFNHNDVEDLLTFIRMLNNSSWLNEVCEGICTDKMHDIKDNVIRNINNTKVIIERSNIILLKEQDLIKVFHQIKIMRNLGEIGKDVDDEFKNLIESFIKNVVNLLDEIKRESDDNQQNQEDKLITLDYIRLEEYLKFFDIIKTIQNINFPQEFPVEKIDSCIKRVKEKLEGHFVFLLRRINNLLINIRRLENKNDAEDVDNIKDILIKINKVNKNFEKCKHYLTDKISDRDLRNAFEQLWMDLNDYYCAFLQTNNLSNLRIIFEKTRRLIIFDEENFIEKKFNILYDQYNKQFYDRIPDTLKTIFDNIDKCRFRDIISILDNLRSAGDHTSKSYMNQSLLRLDYKVKELSEKINSQSRLSSTKLEPEIIEKCVNMMVALKSIQDELYSFINEETKIKIEECIELTSKRINQNIKNELKKVFSIIENNDLINAEKRKDEINDICRNYFHDYCVQDNLDMINTIEDKIEEQLISIHKKYKVLSTTEYFIHPPKDIVTRHREGNHYFNFIKRLNEIITEKFREEIHNLMNESNFNRRQMKLKSLRSSLNSVPEEIRHIIEESIENGLNNMQMENDTLKDDINQCIENLEYNKLLELYKKCLEIQNNEGTSNIKSFITNKTLEIKTDIKQNYSNSNNLTYVIEKLNSLFKIYINFPSLVENIINDTFKFLNSKIQESMISFKRLFEVENLSNKSNEEKLLNLTGKLLDDTIDLNDSSDSDKIKLSTYKNDFKYLSEFLLLIRKNEKQMYLKVFGDSMDEKINRLIKNIIDSINKLNEIIRKNLSGLSPDIFLINNILSKFKCWNSIVFVRIINNDDINYVFSNSDLKCLNKLLDVMTNKEFRYEEYLKLVICNLEEIKQDLKSKNLKDERTRIKETREKFFIELNKEIESIECVTELKDHIPLNKLETIRKESKNEIINKVQILVEESNKILENPKVNADDYENLNLFYENILTMSNHIPSINSNDENNGIELNINEEKKKLEGKIENVVLSLKSQIENEDNAEILSEKLISLQTLADEMIRFQDKSSKIISECINTKIKNAGNGNNILKIIGSLLEKNPTGQSLIRDQPLFKGLEIGDLFNKTRSQNIDYILGEDETTKQKRLEGDQISFKKLKEKFDIVMDTYNNVLKKYLKAVVDYQSILAEMKTYLPNVTQTKNKIKYSSQITSEIPNIIGYIFAIWTLQNSKNYFDLNAQTDPEGAIYLKSPLAAQVVSILRILCLDSTSLTNNLVQIGTGEGKSITLAITCSVLALYGFKVSCACYSKILSERDYEEFQQLFQLLGVTSRISYGTFNELCETKLNSNINIRKKTEAAINGTNILNSRFDSDDSANILIVDEFDVLFSEKFYGQEYIPSVSLKNKFVFTFFQKLWNERTNISMGENYIKTLPEYIDLKNSLGNYDFIINDILYSIEVDLKTFDSVDYIVKDDKIGYSMHGELIFNLNHGYKTLFAYFHEFDKNNISRESLEANVSVLILCGRFSYSELPREFNYILGVTGTLKSLSKTEKYVIENEYNIKKFTYIPSVFGKNNLRFDKKDDVYIETSHDYFNRIEQQIRARIRGSNGGKRCILVFFEDKKVLMEFYNSVNMQDFRNQTNIISDDLTADEKRSYVKKATNPGTITFLLPTLGRGTDFRIRDPDVASNGGIHLILTFVPKLLSEEIQIIGRVARQGDQGSCSFIILDTSLEIFNISTTQISSEPRKYELINQERNINYEFKYQCNQKLISSLKKMHDLSFKFCYHLENNNFKEIQIFLRSLNKGQSKTNIRTIILVDATGSMGKALQVCLIMIGDMYEAIFQILEKFNISKDCFSIQFCAYRNYNSNLDDILVCSPWLQEPGKLREFLNKITNSGGWGNEAIEIALNHVKLQHTNDTPVNQVILIGDANPNTKEEIQSKRNTNQTISKIWSESKYNNVKYYEEELEDIIKNKIPIHSMYINDNAKISFEKISNITNGSNMFLDINKNNATQILTQFVTEEILRKISEKEGLQDALVTEYRSKLSFN